MSYSTQLCLLMTTLLTTGKADPNIASSTSPEDELDLDEVAENALQPVLHLIHHFREQPVTPQPAHQFEQQLHTSLRELGRQLTSWTYNHLEPSNPHDLPKHLTFEATPYTRLNRHTPQNLWTLFGQIRLQRTGYRPTHPDGESTLFPLTVALGLVHGASPALAERAARLLAQAGITQQRLLRQLKQDHGVGWGVKKLRAVCSAVAEKIDEQRPAAQTAQLLTWLEQAQASKGRHKPLLSVGRDGITLRVGQNHSGHYEVASTATISVLDRRGKRLGTVYLGYVPESYQRTMSRELTRLLRGVLTAWQGPLPRLCYVSDAGDNETAYYEQALRKMKHPRTGQPLAWVRVLDYYHASERIWKLGELLFGKGRQAWGWSRKMQKWLLKPGGANRVLHSAAAWEWRMGLVGQKQQEYQKAYAYLSKRIGFMRYAEYRRVGVPCGSGVTEAACKTVYTQRLKLSGMRWEAEGAQTVLNLRVVELSGVWEQAFAAALTQYTEARLLGSEPWGKNDDAKAA